MLPVSRYHHIRSGGKASTIAQDTQSLTHHRFIVRLGHGGQHASRPKADLYKKAAEPHHITRQSAPPSWRERRSEARAFNHPQCGRHQVTIHQGHSRQGSERPMTFVTDVNAKRISLVTPPSFKLTTKKGHHDSRAAQSSPAARMRTSGVA